jgi:hypothetical protein
MIFPKKLSCKKKNKGTGVMTVTIEVLKIISTNFQMDCCLSLNCNTDCHLSPLFPVWFREFHFQTQAQFQQQLSLVGTIKFVYLGVVSYFDFKPDFVDDSFSQSSSNFRLLQ